MAAGGLAAARGLAARAAAGAVTRAGQWQVEEGPLAEAEDGAPLGGRVAALRLEASDVGRRVQIGSMANVARENLKNLKFLT